MGLRQTIILPIFLLILLIITILEHLHRFFKNLGDKLLDIAFKQNE
jgi:hypothetical protein